MFFFCLFEKLDIVWKNYLHSFITEVIRTTRLTSEPRSSHTSPHNVWLRSSENTSTAHRFEANPLCRTLALYILRVAILSIPGTIASILHE